MGFPALTLTVVEARAVVRRFYEAYPSLRDTVPQPGQIRLLVADKLPALPVRLIGTKRPDEGRWPLTWIVERIDTGEHLDVSRGSIKRQMTEMEVVAWFARHVETSSSTTARS